MVDAPTRIDRATLAKAGFSPREIRGFEDLQNFAFEVVPAAAARAQDAAEAAGGQAVAAGATATQGVSDAATAKARADAAYALADGKADKGKGPTWAAAGGLNRTVMEYSPPAFVDPVTAADLQEVSDALSALSRTIVGLVTDLRATGALP